MMAISMANRVAVPRDVLINVIDGESVLLNLKSESYFGLDDVGTRMWQVLTESESIEAAQASLLSEYDVQPQQLRQDLEDLIQQLVEHGLIEIVNG
jgi:hypothetical protein